MDQNFAEDLEKGDVIVPVIVPVDNREKSNKCNQCNYAFSQASHLGTHLKTHSRERLNKCNHCNYASSDKCRLRTHFKIHSIEKSNKPVPDANPESKRRSNTNA